MIPPLKILDHCSELVGAETQRSQEPQVFLNVFSWIRDLTFRDSSSVGLNSPICKMNMMPHPHKGIGRFNYILKFFASGLITSSELVFLGYPAVNVMSAFKFTE